METPRLHWLSLLMLILLALTACSGPATTPSPIARPTETPSLTTTSTLLTLTATVTPRSTRPPTPIPATPTATPEPTPDLRPRSSTYGDVEIRMVANPRDSSQTDVCVENRVTGEKALCVTLSDVYLGHYHNCEYHNGNLYIIRRVGYTPEKWYSREWRDELWRYDAEGKGTRIYSAQGFDFRVAPDERYIALRISDLKNTWQRLIFLDFRGNVVQRFTADQLTAHDEKVHAPLPAHLGLVEWSKDGREFWGVISAGPSPQTFYRIEVSSWQTTLYDISELAIPEEYDLNVNTAKLVYSDCPQIYVADDAEEFAKSQQQVTLFVYALNSQSTQTIATAVAKCFNPRWLDDSTIEYNDPGGDDRITYTVE